MALPDELIRDFAKMVSSAGKEKTNDEVMLYGTARVNSNGVYVLIDGASEPTPAITTMTVGDGERVTLTIKHHTAMITGNLDSPGARKKDSDAAATKADAAQNAADEALEKLANISGKFLHIMYAADSEGANISSTPNDNTKYIGIYSGDSETAPDDPAAYQWSLIKGSDGVGVKGEDGKSAYLHIKYSDDGRTFTSNSGEDPGDWIGTCTDANEADPTTFESYTWKLIKGEDGQNGTDGISPTVKITKTGTVTTITITDKNGTHTQTVNDGETGTPGEPGTDGKTPYFHVKYSNDGGKTFTSNNGEEPGKYLGTCTDYNKTDPTTVSSYSWALIKGEDGTDGVGVKSSTVLYQASDSGTTVPTKVWYQSVPTVQPGQYLWTRTAIKYTDGTETISYSVSKAGEDGKDGQNGTDGISPTVNVSKSNGTTTITITDKNGTHTQTVKDGVDGTPGEPGADGRTPYFHAKYSNDGGKTFTSNSGENPGKYLGTYTDYNETDSTNPSLYSWALIKGEDGTDGKDGSDGVGIESTKVTYQASDSGETVPTKVWYETIPTVQPGQYLWTRTYTKYTDGSNSTSYSVSRIGEDGYSPTVNVSKSNGTTTITITDKNGTHTQTVKDGVDGTPGEPGADGKTPYFHVKYSDDGGKTFTSNSGEDSGDWIGTCTDYSKTDPTDVKQYTWAKLKGEDGEDGNGILSTSILYQASDSGTTVPTKVWYQSVPTVKPGQYLWTRTYIKYTDGTDSTSYSVSKMGEDGKDGKDGQNGTDGKGIKSSIVMYQASSSGVSVPTGDWSTAVPATSSVKPYIWSRTVTTYTDNTTSVSYSVGCTPDGIQVGGRNLLLRSRTLDGNYYTNNNAALSKTDVTSNDVTYVVAHMQRENMTSGQYAQYCYTYDVHDLKPDTPYTLSFWAKGNGVIRSFLQWPCKSTINSDGYTSSDDSGTSELTLSDTWERYWITWTTKDTLTDDTFSLILARIAYSIANSASSFYLYAPKLEIGNKATDWTPAPEDVDGDLKDLDTNLRDTIADASKDTLDASKDMMDDKLSDYVKGDAYDSFKTTVEAKMEVLESDITMKFNTVTESVNTVDSNVTTKFSELTKYIRFTNNGIEIGAGENELKLELDNDMIKFTKSGEPIGWWDGNDFHTGNLVVDVNEHAQFGNFAFVPRSDGSLMFLKVKD